MTVAEMIAMADQYPSSAAGMMRTNNKKLPFQKIVDSLSPTEEVVLAFGASAGSVGKTPYQIVAVVFTNERLLIAGRPNSLIGSFMEAGVKSIKIDKVNSIGVFGMNVRLDTLGDEDIALGSYAPEIRTKLSAESQKIVDQYQSTHRPVGQTITNVIQKSPAEQIKEYKELMDSGIITPEDFEAKKKQLLGL